MDQKRLTETDVKRQIKDTLHAVGALPVSIWQGMMSKKGVSDILVCYQGKFVAIEVKKPGWKLPGRQAKSYQHYYRQKEFIDQVKAAGGIGFFANCVEDVVKELGLEVKLYPLFHSKKSENGNNGGRI